MKTLPLVPVGLLAACVGWYYLAHLDHSENVAAVEMTARARSSADAHTADVNSWKSSIRPKDVKKPSRSPDPICIRLPRVKLREDNPTRGFLTTLYSVTFEDGQYFGKWDLMAEFARMIVRLREVHPDYPIAVVVDSTAESWLRGKKFPGMPDPSCMWGYNITGQIDVVINGERDPRTAETWKQGQKFMLENIRQTVGAVFVLHTVAWRLTPWEQTIFIDADIMPCGSLEPLFNSLERFDASMVANWALYRKGDPKHPEFLNVIGDAFNEANLGFFVYKYNTPGVQCLLNQTFHIHVAKLPGAQGRWNFINDQPPFMMALWECRNANIWMLQDEWNCFGKKSCSDTADVDGRIPCRVLHTHRLFEMPEFRLEHWAG